MKILAGEPTGQNAKKAIALGVGAMVCTSRVQHLAGNRHKKFNFTAVDNGAFGCFKSGKPFNDDLFLRNVEKVNKIGLEPLFIVCPDIVAGGLRSLDFSMSYLDKIDYDKIALVVQDGMIKDDVLPIIDNFQYLFVGGSVKWKWQTAEEWVKIAHKSGIPCHIGQCGRLWMLEAADRFKADSVDSTSWVVNKSWHIVEEFLQPKQLRLDLWS